MRIISSTFALVIAATSAPLSASAQNTEEATAAQAAPSASDTATKTPDIAERLKALEEQVNDLRQENKNLSSQLSEVQEAQAQSAAETPSDIGKTKVFGFFDTTFARVYFSKKDAIFKANLPLTDNSTFLLSGLNVYLGNQITQHLKFLSELRFTYQPLGSETSTETYYVLPNGTATNLGTKYSRTNTSVVDPTTVQTYQLGGVSMERVQATYVFNDYFGITAGRFLTPYGIWNVDHGSPVILMTRAPVMQTQQIVPIQQLGIQLFGRAYILDSLSLDYAATLSNGRGPMDTVVDLDNDKGVGLRWRLNYESDNVSVSLGQYGYTGKYTDISKAIYVGPGSAEYSAVVTPTEQYREYVLANDLLIKFYGLRLQSEAVLRRVKYQISPKLSPADFNGNPVMASQYNAPSYDARAVYGLIAYELPEQLTTSKLRLTPFAYLERFDLNDASVNNSQAYVYSLGLNIKPYTSLVFKLEYDHVKFDDLTDLLPDGTTRKTNNGTMQVVNVQLAVTF